MKVKTLGVPGCATLILLSCAGSQERKISETDVPGPVLAAFQNQYPNAQVREYGEEVEDGRKIYEISFSAEDRKMDVTYTADGKPFEVEETIVESDLPQVIRDGIVRKFGKADIAVAEKVSKGGQMNYEVKIETAMNGKKKEYELVFSPEGKLLEQEEDKAD